MHILKYPHICDINMVDARTQTIEQKLLNKRRSGVATFLVLYANTPLKEFRHLRASIVGQKKYSETFQTKSLQIWKLSLANNYIVPKWKFANYKIFPSLPPRKIVYKCIIIYSRII